MSGLPLFVLTGKDKGVVWTKPFRVDITDGLKEGENDVIVEVTNSWFNRVAGDEMAVAPTKYTQTNVVLGNDFRGNAISEITLETFRSVGTSNDTGCGGTEVGKLNTNDIISSKMK